MSSEEEIKEMGNTLEEIVDDSPENYKAGVHETCEHYFHCLLWVVGEIDTNHFVKGLLLSETGKEAARRSQRSQLE